MSGHEVAEGPEVTADDLAWLREQEEASRDAVRFARCEYDRRHARWDADRYARILAALATTAKR